MGLGKFIKKAVKQVGGAALTAAGAYYGGPAGASFGSSLGSSLGLDTSGILGNLVNGAVGLGQDYLQSQINLAQQKELAKYNANQQSILNQQAFDNNLKMWGMQNFYNSPSEQMKRLQSAGMNPNLVYGSGNITGNTAGSVPQLEPAKFDTGAFQPVDTRIQKAQLLLALESQHQQIRNQQIENDFTREKIKLAARDADRSDKLAAAQINALAQGYALTDARINDIYYKHDQPKSWIGRNYSDIKDVASDISSNFTTYVKNKFKEKYPKLSNFHWY